MRGFAFAGYEDGDLFIFECSSEYEAYPKWHPVFKSILKSGQKHLFASVQENGSYRRFQDDEAVRIIGRDLLDFYE